MDTTYTGQHRVGVDDTTLDARTLMQWGFKVDLDGIAAHEDEAEQVVAAARRAGLSPVLVGVLADRTEPAPARTRSFGRLAMALGV